MPKKAKERLCPVEGYGETSRSRCRPERTRQCSTRRLVRATDVSTKSRRSFHPAATTAMSTRRLCSDTDKQFVLGHHGETYGAISPETECAAHGRTRGSQKRHCGRVVIDANGMR